jgi:hypothetical protein
MVRLGQILSGRRHMSVSFTISALSNDQVPLAFPLIQATWPNADLASWLSFVAFFDDPAAAAGSGVLALRDPAGCICGVLAYRLDRDLQAGLILAVHLFTAIDLANSLRTVRALLDAVELRGVELGCTGLQIRLHSDQPELAQRLRALGLAFEGGVFWKKIESELSKN